MQIYKHPTRVLNGSKLQIGGCCLFFKQYLAIKSLLVGTRFSPFYTLPSSV